VFPSDWTPVPGPFDEDQRRVTIVKAADCEPIDFD